MCAWRANKLMFGKCHCKNVDFGSYDNQVSMKNPFGVRKDGWVCIDVCIASEIGYLWNQGIETFNSCCGHQKLEPSVIVSEDCIKKMYELGYKISSIKSLVQNQNFTLKTSSELLEE
jgi:hypothetical protein